MKKLLFVMMAVVAASFVSCGNRAEVSTPDTDTVTVDSTLADSLDSVVVDTVVDCDC